MDEKHHQQQELLDSGDADYSSACGRRNKSGKKPSSLDFMAAAFRQSSSSNSNNSSTPKTEQPLFSSLRDVAIQQQVDDEDAAGVVLRQMMQSWILGIIVPMSIVAWYVTKHSWSATVAAALFMPTFAILQGAIGLLTYRLYYGDAPIPLSPSHGVVVAVAACASSSCSGSKNNSTMPTTIQQQQQQQQQTRVSSGGCECCGMNSSCSSAALSKELTLFLQRQQEQAILYQQQQSQQQQQQPAEASTSLQQQQQQQQTEPPIRLLVIGDSLAIGAGQQNSCTPIMPEIIAKTLSQKMGGRVVYWTCHGQTGASAAMLVRELERGQSAVAAAAAATTDLDSSIRSTLSMDENDLEIRSASRSSLYLPSPPKAAVAIASAPRSSSSSGCSDTDDSSSEDEYTSPEFNTTPKVPVRARTCSDITSNRRSTGRRRLILRRATRTAAMPLRGGEGEEEKDYHTFKTTFDTNETSTTTTAEEEKSAASSSSSLATWRDLLKQHRKLFEHPEYMGPYDIVVVLTGPNDLKGAVFPFLLHGEDKEFQRQAQERGGSYRLELRRLLETLNRKMQWGNFQQFVSAAKESMREKMEETMERIIIITNSASTFSTTTKTSTTLAKEATTMTISAALPQTNDAQNQHEGIQSQGLVADEDEQRHQQNTTGNTEHVPLIVLPGMPARALPLFQHVPLRWLAVPATDMMDMHKRHLAKSHPNEVLFVNAPMERELGSFVEKKNADIIGDDVSKNNICDDETVLLALRDVKRRDCRRARGAMQSYYAKKALGQKSTCSAYMNNPFKLIRTHLLGFPPASHLKAFSPDGVHPNDMGYEFWGRHIANAIYDKYMAKNEQASNANSNG